MKFVWDDIYSVQIEVIDEQHKMFFDFINKIYDLVENNTVTKESLLSVIVELYGYAFYHLTTEETYFEKFNYDNKEQHVQAHNLYRQKMQEAVEKVSRTDVNLNDLAEEVADFAKKWLSGHILHEDKKFVACFHEHGLE